MGLIIFFHERHEKHKNFAFFVYFVEENDQNSLFSQNNNEAYLRKGALLPRSLHNTSTLIYERNRATCVAIPLRSRSKMIDSRKNPSAANKAHCERRDRSSNIGGHYAMALLTLELYHVSRKTWGAGIRSQELGE